MDWIKDIGDIFDVRVTPKASANRIKVKRNEDGSLVLRVYVTTVPEDGKANEAVIKLLSKELKIPKTSFRIIRGGSSRDKTIEILREKKP